MDLMDLDHDMDVDVDLVADEPIVAELEIERPDDRSDGEIDDDPNTRVPDKVHISGLEMMNPDDIKAYTTQYLGDIAFRKVEWIDDSSANLVFADASHATQALSMLAAEPIHDAPPRTLFPANAWSTRPEIVLKVRPALESDRKQAGAAQRSRFYLLHPEYDPEERRRRSDARRYRQRDGERHPRRRAREIEEDFDVNLYDDQPAERRERRGAGTPDSDTRERARNDSYRRANSGRELFPDRDRSMSPGREQDDEESGRERNRLRAHAIKSHASRQHRARELFPEAGRADKGRLGDKVEETADLVARGIALPLMDGNSDVRNAGPKSKLADRVSKPGSGGEFSIRGTAAQKTAADTGFAIKGRSVKELFPDKFGSNAGKELFAEGIQSRPRQRRKAGDLFD